MISIEGKFFYDEIYVKMLNGTISKKRLTEALKEMANGEYELSEIDDRIVDLYKSHGQYMDNEQRTILRKYIFDNDHLAYCYLKLYPNLPEEQLREVIKALETGPIYYYYFLAKKERKISTFERMLVFEALLKGLKDAIYEPDEYDEDNDCCHMNLNYAIFDLNELKQLVDKIFELQLIEEVYQIKKTVNHIPKDLVDKLDSLLVADKLIHS